MIRGTISMGFVFGIILLALNNFTHSLSYQLGELYCTIRHPEEAITSSRHTCERQHLIQRQSKGSDTENVIFVNTYEHDYLDRSRWKPWERNRPWLKLWGDDNLESAFMMGVYANGYHYQVYDYQGEHSATTLLKWDGASHATYVLASLFNFITKSLSYVDYQFEKDQPMFIDATVGILIDFVELGVGIGYGALGMIVGTIWNPIDTALNLIPACALVMESTFKGVANTLLDIVSLVTLRSISWTL